MRGSRIGTKEALEWGIRGEFRECEGERWWGWKVLDGGMRRVASVGAEGLVYVDNLGWHFFALLRDRVTSMKSVVTAVTWRVKSYELGIMSGRKWRWRRNVWVINWLGMKGCWCGTVGTVRTVKKRGVHDLGNRLPINCEWVVGRWLSGWSMRCIFIIWEQLFCCFKIYL